MPIYIGDYLGDTMHLTTVEHGAYFLLMLAYWKNGGPLRNDDKFLATVCRLTAKKWAVVKPRLLPFFQISEGMLVQKRIQYELAHATNKSAQMAANAAKRVCRSNAEALPNATPSPSPSPLIDIPVELPPGFPKDENAAIAHASSVGCPPEFAAGVWNKAMGRGGRDAKDMPVRSFHHYLATEWKYERNRQAEKKHHDQHRNPSSKRTDLGAGTANDGTADQYAHVGKGNRVSKPE